MAEASGEAPQIDGVGQPEPRRPARRFILWRGKKENTGGPSLAVVLVMSVDRAYGFRLDSAGSRYAAVCWHQAPGRARADRRGTAQWARGGGL